jgi:hypothetical protein
MEDWPNIQGQAKAEVTGNKRQEYVRSALLLLDT